MTALLHNAHAFDLKTSKLAREASVVASVSNAKEVAARKAWSDFLKKKKKGVTTAVIFQKSKPKKRPHKANVEQLKNVFGKLGVKGMGPVLAKMGTEGGNKNEVDLSKFIAWLNKDSAQTRLSGSV